MSNPGLTKTFIASGAIPGRSLVKFGADDNTVVVCSAAADLIIGVSERVDCADGDRIDVVLTGSAEAVAGGNVTRGQEVTSDGNGAAITSAPAAGTAKRKVGVALQSAVAGDFFDVLINPGQVTTPAA